MNTFIVERNKSKLFNFGPLGIGERRKRRNSQVDKNQRMKA